MGWGLTAPQVQWHPKGSTWAFGGWEQARLSQNYGNCPAGSRAAHTAPPTPLFLTTTGKKKKTVLETTLFYYFTLFLCPTQPLHNYVKWMEKTWNVLLLWDEIQLGEGADKEKEEKEVMRNRHEEIMSQINQLCKWILSNQLFQPKAVQICLCWWLRAVKVILVQLWVVRCWPESDS